ncbi:MAG TPA: tetratricopeptide repeat protein [Ktedonobacterales bacterium]|nr:tetratricopeptide repeat protein [Ktedonobacterales bacterium]
MSVELAIEALVVSRLDDPPAAPAVARALAAAGLGAVEYTPASAPTGAIAARGRQRLGTFTASVPGLSGASCRIGVYRYETEVMDGLSEAAFAALTKGLASDDLRTLREGRVALDLRLSAADSNAPRALDWLTRVQRVLLELTQGVAVDPAAQRCYGRADLARLATSDPLAFIVLHDEAWDADSRWLHTHGMQKLGRPELDVVAVPLSLHAEASAFLRDVAFSLAGGARLAPGDEIDLGDAGRAVAVSAPVDDDHRAPFGRLRLADAPLPGERQTERARRLLCALALSEAARRASAGAGDVAGALADCDRVLAADPDEPAALALKARLYLRAGRTLDALSLADLMELRAPGDYRGPLIAGLALAALGRDREALHALNRAIEREPEAAEVYAVRSQVHERLGDARMAAEDRTHAAYLRAS